MQIFLSFVPFIFVSFRIPIAIEEMHPNRGNRCMHVQDIELCSILNRIDRRDQRSHEEPRHRTLAQCK